jgi:hypothetical protein
MAYAHGWTTTIYHCKYLGVVEWKMTNSWETTGNDGVKNTKYPSESKITDDDDDVILLAYYFDFPREFLIGKIIITLVIKEEKK